MKTFPATRTPGTDRLCSKLIRGNTVQYLLLSVLILGAAFNTAAQTTTYNFTPIPFSNPDILSPGRGAEHWFSVADWDDVNTVKVPSGTVRGKDYYVRMNWAQIENPGSGTTPGTPRYNWATFDAYINIAITNGWKFNFGILTICEGYNPYGSPGGYDLSYPLYLHNQMQAESLNSRDWASNMSMMWVPNWNSPNYLNALDALNNAIAAHINSTSYNGVPYKNAVGYIDIRGYGHFGEWHNYPYIDETPTGRTATVATLKRIIDSHKNAFPDNRLVSIMNAFDGAGSTRVSPEVAYYILTQTNNVGRFGWRRDNWGQWIFDEVLEYNPLVYNPGTGNVSIQSLISEVWKTAPVVGEPSNSGTDVTMDFTRPPYYELPAEIRKYHASSFGNGNWYGGAVSQQQMRDTVVAASKWCGYRLTPVSAEVTTAISRCTPFAITLNWKNTGIAPVYDNWDVTYELRNGSNVKVWSAISSFSLKTLLPAATATPITESFSLPNSLAAGTYSLVMIIRDPLNYRSPLPLAVNGRAADGSYLIRSVVLGAPEVNALPVARAGADLSISSSSGQATLSAAASTDPEGGTLQYAWSRISGPVTPVIANAASMNTSVTGMTTNGIYKFQLQVTDDHCNTAKDTIQVTASAASPNIPPVAVAGPDETIYATTASLNGTASYDPDGFLAGYQWTKVSGPAIFTLTNPTAAVASMSNLMLGDYALELKVTDNAGAITKDTIVIHSQASILPVQWRSLSAKAVTGKVILSWTLAGGSGSDNYYVEKSLNGKDFNWIGTVRGTNSTTLEQEYLFEDYDAGNSKFYYRIQYSDASGKKTISPVFSVTPGSAVNSNIQVYPNPVTDQLLINWPAVTRGTAIVKVVAADGKQILQQQVVLSGSHAVTRLNTASWNPGIFVIEIQIPGSQSYQYRILKL